MATWSNDNVGAPNTTTTSIGSVNKEPGLGRTMYGETFT